MATKHRLFLPPPLEATRPLILPRERAHYLIRVLRLRRGQTLEVFDGAGRAWTATLADASARSATLELGDLVAQEAEPAPRIHLVQGLLKGAAMDVVVQKATELGATDLWPVLAERSNVPAGDERRQRKAGHWQKVVESAAEQCGALHLPRLHPVQGIVDFLSAPPPAALIILDLGAPAFPLELPRSDTCLLIGPEGGWSESERRAAAETGARRYGLGTRILRAETAPLAVLAALRHGWGWH